MGDGEGPSLDVTWKLTFDEESGSHRSVGERGLDCRDPAEKPAGQPLQWLESEQGAWGPEA